MSAHSAVSGLPAAEAEVGAAWRETTGVGVVSSLSEAARLCSQSASPSTTCSAGDELGSPFCLCLRLRL